MRLCRLLDLTLILPHHLNQIVLLLPVILLSYPTSPSPELVSPFSHQVWLIDRHRGPESYSIPNYLAQKA